MAGQRAQALIGLGHLERIFGSGNAPASRYFNEAIALARRNADFRAESSALRGLGELALQSSATDAREFFSEARALARMVGDDLLLANAESGLGRLDTMLNRADSAREHLSVALAIYRRLPEPSGAGDVIQAFAILEGDDVRRQERSHEALELYRYVRDRRGQIYALLDLAAIQQRRGETEPRRQLCAEALGLASELGTVHSRGVVLARLCSAEWESGDKDRARQLYQEAAAIGDEGEQLLLGDIAVEMEDYDAACRHYIGAKHWRSSLGLAAVARIRGQFEQCRAHLVEALNALRRDRATSTEVRCLLELAEVEDVLDRSSEADSALSTALQLASAAGFISQQAQALERLGKSAQARNQYETAERHFRDAVALFGQVRNEPGASCAMTHLGDCLLERGTLDAAEDQFRNAVALASRSGAYQPRGYATRGLALVHSERGEADAARRLFDEARAIFSAQSDHVGLADVTVDVGYFEETRDKARAVICFREAAELYGKGGRADLSTVPLEEAARLVAPPVPARTKRGRAKPPAS
jgi:tetratricopeptide (TPR) repeat protein